VFDSLFLLIRSLMFNHEISGFADSMHVGTQTSCDMVFIWARHQSSPPYLE
jgi:hypothetical protein